MRIKLTVLFLLLSMVCFADGIPSPATPRLQVDSNGTKVSDSSPLPIKIIGASSITVSIGEVEDGIASTNLKLDTLNASLTQSLMQIENAASATTSMVNVEGETILGELATISTALEAKLAAVENAASATTNMVNVESDETQGSLATMATAIETSQMRIENTASATTSMVNVEGERMLGSISSSSSAIEVKLAAIENAASATIDKIDLTNNLTNTTLATMSAAIEAKLTAVENAASATTAAAELNTNNILGSIATSSAASEVLTEELITEIATASTEATTKANQILTSLATISALYSDIATITLIVTATSQDISPLSGRKWISFQNQGTCTTTIHSNGTPSVYGAGRLIYPQGSITYQNVDDSIAFSAICDTAMSTNLYIEQGK